MAYIGLQPQQKTLGTSTQLLNGNGVDYEYTLNRAVSKAADITVFVDDVIQVPEVDYTASGLSLLFVTQPSNGTNNININYKAGALSTIYVTANAYPTGTTTAPSIYAVGAPSTGLYFPSITSVATAVSGNTRLTITDSPSATSTTTGAMRVVGGVGITGATYIGGSTHIVDTTESTDSTSGALLVSGGIGVAKNLNINGSLNVGGDFTVAGQFTTTGSDSLILNDPFVFLANANPGDNLDTGFVSSYFDGIDNRYTGLFRDITDNKYKLFSNLLIQPTTTVDTANVSFGYADLYLGNLKVYGNVASTTSTTGALTVAGGIGATGTVYVNSSNNLVAVGNGGTNGVGNIGASGATFHSVHATNFYGTLQTAAQTNITSVGTLSSLTTSGRIAPNANVSIDLGSTTNYWNNLYAASVNATSGYITGSVTVGGGIYGTVSTAAQGSITSLGTLTSLAVSGAITVNSGNNATAIANGGTNGAGNIGASGATFNTIYAKATTAQYADLAEKYLADVDYEPGTVLMFGGEYEVTECKMDMCPRVAGVVSTNPGFIMNETLEGTVAVVALTGRVPTKVSGTISKGDLLVSAGNGRARAESNPRVGSVIGKALENFNGLEGVIEVVVGRV